MELLRSTMGSDGDTLTKWLECAMGDLGVSASDNWFGVNVRLKLAVCIAAGVAHIHSFRFAHTDLKTDNVSHCHQLLFYSLANGSQ
jgi:hypothetical protein